MRRTWRALLCAGLALVLGAAVGGRSAASVPLEPAHEDAAQILVGLRRAASTGTVLYIGAHPDDENTAVLAALSLGKGVRTVYLSLTRGGGGQNLIGPQQGDALGVIRTQELLRARSIDHAEQRFTRAIDFGYSKSSEESLRLWGHEALLSDVVWTIRSVQPDVIITRFTPTRGGHGHHTASAILADEAFSAAADPAKFPEQLRWVSPWQARRIVWNRFNWGRPPATAPEQPTDASLDVGAYSPLLGRSYTELAALSRSMHKSQAMGTSGWRGRRLEWFEHVAGVPATHRDLFDGIDVSWARIPGGQVVGDRIAEVTSHFDPHRPAASVEGLVAAWNELQRLKDRMSPGRFDYENRTMLRLIRDCAGLWLEAVADQPSVVAGGSVQVTATAIKRSDVPLTLTSITMAQPALERAVGKALDDNRPLSKGIDVTVPSDMPPTQPYWLAKPPEGFLRPLSPPPLRDRADTPAPLQVTFTITAEDGTRLPFEVPVLQRFVDPVEGERYREVAIVPPVSVRLSEPVVVVSKGTPRTLHVTVTANTAGAAGTLSLELPEGWQAEPSQQAFTLDKPGDSASFELGLRAEDGADKGTLTAVAQVGSHAVRSAVTTIDFPHIAPQTMLEPARAHLLRLDAPPLDLRVGYVMGSGDDVPQALTQLGCHVTLLSDEDLATGDLDKLDVIMTGVRAFNTRTSLAGAHARLMDYIQRGGRLVVQYNTLQKLVTEEIGPYPLQISHDRVSVETVPVTLKDPESPLLQRPFKITTADFDGWVQERGLYFPSHWDKRYDALLACSDPGEPSRAGGLLVTHFGRGIFVYTSYSLFRQLPAGVPGAYRLLADLLAGGDTTREAAR